MHTSRRKHEAEGVIGVPRELATGVTVYWRDRCVSRVIADRPMSNSASPTSDNLTPQEPTKQVAPEMNTDGAGLS